MSESRSADPPPDPADQPAFLGFEPAPPASGGPASAGPASAGYRVLARKYRPQTFADLIGQDAMVQTVRNAFSTGRIPQAWMLTGVRGVGKTTTARILARALNYDSGAGAAPSIDMPELGVHCRSIMESRHIDVLEMDAASHTGVENIRQITDAVRYAPVQARYKVYIIDEVHMLSAAAFNAFLKTLEEPPPHAKFVFATTEIRKVPVTILSRCQRFDLRRVEIGTLGQHLERICRAEDVGFEPDALATIARAAEGSVRDALSLLDQAVAHGAGTVSSAGVREMLGLADRGQVIALFESVMKGDVPAAFATLRAGYDSGADPRQMLEDLAQFTHLVTRLKLVPEAAKDASLTEAERVQGADFASRLPVGALSRTWQILLKAIGEVAAAPRPLAAAEMVLVRLAYAADLPAPEDLLRRLRSGGADNAAGDREGARPTPPSRHSSGGPAGGRAPESGAWAAGPRLEAGSGPPDGSGGRATALASRPASSRPEPRVGEAVPQPAPVALRRFTDVVALAGERRQIALKAALERDVRLVRFEEGRIDLALEPNASRSIPGELTRWLNDLTGRRWIVSVSAEAPGVATLAEDRRRREGERREGAAGHPLVQAVLRSFPGAEIVDVRDRAADPDQDPGTAAEMAAPDDPADADDI